MGRNIETCCMRFSARSGPLQLSVVLCEVNHRTVCTGEQTMAYHGYGFRVLKEDETLCCLYRSKFITPLLILISYLVDFFIVVTLLRPLTNEP